MLLHIVCIATQLHRTVRRKWLPHTHISTAPSKCTVESQKEVTHKTFLYRSLRQNLQERHMLQPVYSKGAFPALASLLPRQAWSGLIGDCSTKLYAHTASICVTAQHLATMWTA